jgi:hypothetical protein
VCTASPCTSHNSFQLRVAVIRATDAHAGSCEACGGMTTLTWGGQLAARVCALFSWRTALRASRVPRAPVGQPGFVRSRWGAPPTHSCLGCLIATVECDLRGVEGSSPHVRVCLFVFFFPHCYSLLRNIPPGFVCAANLRWAAHGGCESCASESSILCFVFGIHRLCWMHSV